jgi:hypothetical protein
VIVEVAVKRSRYTTVEKLACNKSAIPQLGACIKWKSYHLQSTDAGISRIADALPLERMYAICNAVKYTRTVSRVDFKDDQSLSIKGSKS